jgi:hypothetical protein
MLWVATIGMLSAGILFGASPRLDELPAARGFPTAEAAADALVMAAGNDDAAALTEILGPAAENIVSGDPTADRRIRRDFAAHAAQKMRLVARAGRTGEMTLLTGAQEWPLPIPIVKIGASWYFDTDGCRRRKLRK